MTPLVGIMQGRLLPPFEGRFQAFPAHQWRDEFAMARSAGLACIEWIYERPHEKDNPLGSEAGIAEIRRLAGQTEVGVRSICADYYMTDRLVTEEGTASPVPIAHLEWLIGQAAVLGATYMVLPFVDASSLRDQAQVAAAITVLKRAGAIARQAGVELHIECDLPPERFAALLAGIGEPAVRANVDIGNSASLGWDPDEELAVLGPHLGSVHVKDRPRGGGTVPLGTGDANFPRVFRRIAEAGFDRWFILQTARAHRSGAEIDPIDLARENRLFVERNWEAAWNSTSRA